MKVQQFRAKNQFLIITDKKIYFQSYETLIALLNKETNEFVINKDATEYNRTISKYLYEFLRDICGLSVNNKKDLEKYIKIGIIKEEVIK